MLEQTVYTLMNEQTLTNRQYCCNHHDKSTDKFIHGRSAVREWWNNKIEQQCYNNHILVVVSSRVLHVLTYTNNHVDSQAVYNMSKHDLTTLIFYQSCSIMLAIMSYSVVENNPVTVRDIFSRAYRTRPESWEQFWEVSYSDQRDLNPR